MVPAPTFAGQASGRTRVLLLLQPEQVIQDSRGGLAGVSLQLLCASDCSAVFACDDASPRTSGSKTRFIAVPWTRNGTAVLLGDGRPRNLNGRAYLEVERIGRTDRTVAVQFADAFAKS